MSVEAIISQHPEILPGQPVWVDLASPDRAASMDFYGGLLGWTFRTDPESGYIIAFSDDLPVGGLFAADQYLPPGWTIHFAVGSAHNTVERVRQLGGQVVLGPVEIAGQGRLAVVLDPAGAAVGFLQPVPSWRFGTKFANTFNWAELNTWDGALADQFFHLLFDFEQEQIGDGDTYDYTTWSLHGEQVVGRLRMGPEFPADYPPHWMIYFGVDPAAGRPGGQQGHPARRARHRGTVRHTVRQAGRDRDPTARCAR